MTDWGRVGAIAGIVAVPVAVIAIIVAHVDATPLQPSQSTPATTSTWPTPAPSSQSSISAASAPEPSQANPSTPLLDEVRYQGVVRVPSGERIIMSNKPPSIDRFGGFGDVGFVAESETFGFNRSAGGWAGGQLPTKAQCIEAVGTNGYSSSEMNDGVRLKVGDAACGITFSGDYVFYIKVRQIDLSTGAATLDAIVWV